MPKMKTKSSAKKRFSIRAGGSIKRGQAFKRHILTKKTTKVQASPARCTAVHDRDEKLRPRHDALRVRR